MFEVLTIANSVLIIMLCWMHKDLIKDLYPSAPVPKTRSKKK
jgi:hypothetical protein